MTPRYLVPLWILALGACEEPASEPCSCEEEAAEAPLDPRTVAQVLEAERVFVWSDGTSIYTMRADHTFELEPDGDSGRTIEGRWRWAEGSTEMVQVFGRWGWMNGMSRNDDYRTMRFSVAAPMRASTLPGEDRAYAPFFAMEELVSITPEQYEEGLRTCT